MAAALTDNLVSRFHEQGYLAVDTVLDDEDLEDAPLSDLFNSKVEPIRSRFFFPDDMGIVALEGELLELGDHVNDDFGDRFDAQAQELREKARAALEELGELDTPEKQEKARQLKARPRFSGLKSPY